MPTKIIKPGKKPGNEYDPIRFECSRCGCVFEVDAADYGDDHMGGPLSPDYAAICPTCDKWCFSKGAKK